MNSALQAAHKAKEALATMKMQVKGNTFTVQMALSIFPRNETAPKKVLYCMIQIFLTANCFLLGSNSSYS